MKSVPDRFDSNKIKQWVNLGAILAAFFINIWANIAPLNGLTIGEISNKFFNQVLIVPANYAFAIWGVIYLGLISFGVYQVLPAQRQNPILPRIGYFLAVASLAQTLWIFLFLYRLFPLSVVAMVAILLPLIGIYLRLGIGQERVSRKELWLVHIPFSIYLGWISVATIVNVAIALYSINGNSWGFSPQVWTVIMLIVAAAIAATISFKRTDIAFPSVIIWASVAIAVRQANQPLIAFTAGGLAIALGLIVLVRVLRLPLLGSR